MRHIVLSFWVHRPDDFPKAAPYLDMLRVLDGSCHRAGFDHVVLTDIETKGQVIGAGLNPFATDLPRSLMQASTEAPARWLESRLSAGVHSIFVGADCIVRQDFRNAMPDCDLAVAFMRGHKKWRINTGFVSVRPESRTKVAPLIREIANDTSEEMCDDMLAFERALMPMPPTYGVYERRGLSVEFLPLPVWNRYMAWGKKGKPSPLDDAAEDANVLHFMGGWEDGKALFFQWAKRHGFDG